jgi:hypothetical protein
MKLPSPSSSNFERAPEGSFVGVCYQVIDLGTQESTFYKSAAGEPKRAHKVLIAWELPDERGVDGRPLMIARRYTFSAHKNSALRAHLDGWRGKAFSDEEIAGYDLKGLLGKGCLLSIVHTADGEDKYANVNMVAKLPKGMTAPAPENVCVYFTLDPFAPAVYATLSAKLQETIAKSPEYDRATTKAAKAGAYESKSAQPKQSLSDELNDDIPW